MAEVCPFCGSKDLATSGIGWVEKAIEAPVTGVVAGAGKIGHALKTGSASGPTGIWGKLGGMLLDGICFNIADAIVKNIPTGRTCKKCGRSFHSTPDKGWYQK